MMIRFEHTRKLYDGAAAITDLNLDIQQGELLVLLGPSGSGKSTVLKMVNRMVSHDGGQILFKGKDINSFNLQDLRRRMGYAIQSVGLFPHRTVAHNIATVPKLLGWDAQRVQARVNELLTLLALDPEQYASRYPHQLSGGQQQRAAIARTLVQGADLILADEPIASLDPESSRNVMEILTRIQREDGRTVVVSLHQVDMAIRYCPRVIALNQGRVVYDGPSSQLTPALLRELYGMQADEFLSGSELLTAKPSAAPAPTLAWTNPSVQMA